MFKRNINGFRSRLKNEGLKVDATPMTDMVFLLLIFFMLSSSFLALPGIKIQLPKASIVETDQNRNIVISIDKTGKIFINDKETKLDKLLQTVPYFFEEAKTKTVMIKADEKIYHGLVVEVMDILKQSGAEKIAIATKPKTIN